MEPSELFQGLSGRFYSFSWHFEEVRRLPRGCRGFARSSACGIQAMQVGNKPVYGLQFHPERDAVEADARFTLAKAEKTDPRMILNPTKSKQLFDPKVGETIFKNFFALCQKS
jgi:GMP synthase (glutamine-hydrolysing)